MKKISWIQACWQTSVSASLEFYTEQIRQAAKLSPDLVVLPELFLNDYFAIKQDSDNFKLAIELDSHEINHFRALAQELELNLALSFFEKQSSAVFYNSLIVINTEGQLQGHYRKMHIPDDPGFNEKYYFSPGDLGFRVSQVNGLNCGLLVCWDQWFPEAARLTAMQGADLLIYPTAIAWDDKEDPRVYQSQLEAWQTIMRSHAIANNVFVLAVNRIGQEGHLKFWGSSFVADPYGKILKQNSIEESAISSVELDLSLIAEARQAWPYFRDRRVDQYHLLKEKWL